MKLFLFYLCANGLITHSITSQNQPNGSITLTSKPAICTYSSPGPQGYNDTQIPTLLPQNIPKECEIILYDTFIIDINSTIECDTNTLKEVSQLRPVFIMVSRKNRYDDWAQILTPQVNENDVTALVNFAQQYNVLGFELNDLTPSLESQPKDVLNPSITQNIIPYIKKIKDMNSNLIVGINIIVAEAVLTNPSVVDFDLLNGVVDYYELKTFTLAQKCDPSLYNGLTPLHKIKQGPGYMMSMEEAIDILKTTKCDMSKVYMIVEIYPYNLQSTRNFFSYSEVCTGHNFDSWCIQNSNDLYQKGKYAKEQNCGINIAYVNFDNTVDDCGCGTFVGVTNIIAGYDGGEQKVCLKFDVRASMEKY